MTEEEKKEEPAIYTYIRGIFSEEIEKKLLQNWNVLPLRVFDECRRLGVQFVESHRKSISAQEVDKAFLTRKGGLTISITLGELWGGAIEPKEKAHVVLLKTDDVSTLIALADEFEINDKKPKIMFLVESPEYSKLDRIAEYKEKVVADLGVLFSAVQQVLDQKEIEIWIDVVHMMLRLPKDSKFKRELDIIPLTNWAQEILEIPVGKAESRELDRLYFDWKKDGYNYSAGISNRTILLEIGEKKIEGDTISVLKELLSMISKEYKTIQNIKQIVIEG